MSTRKHHRVSSFNSTTSQPKKGGPGWKRLPIKWGPSPAFKIPIPRDERQRLAALRRYDIVDTPPEKNFDRITVLATHICQTPIALLVLIDEGRQWFKAKVGVRFRETPRELAFCAHAIMQRHIFIIPDASRDERFAQNPLVTSGPKYRFYAASPLVTPDRRVLGTLCVIDRVRRTLNAAQKADLIALSRLVMTELELRRRLREERSRNEVSPRPAKAPQPNSAQRKSTTKGKNS